jgi:hypothetical protein
MKADKTIASKQNRVAQSPATVTSTAGFAAPKPKAQSDFARPALYYSLANIQLSATDTATGLSAERVGEIAATGVNGTPRPLPYFNRVQQAFGKHDISHVQTYADGQAIQAAKSIGAEAYASGHKIAFANTNPSLHTVAHEAAHIVQQQAGVHLKGGVGQAGDKYEQHADRVADAVVAGRSAESLLNSCQTGHNGASGGVQRELKIGEQKYDDGDKALLALATIGESLEDDDDADDVIDEFLDENNLARYNVDMYLAELIDDQLTHTFTSNEQVENYFYKRSQEDRLDSESGRVFWAFLTELLLDTENPIQEITRLAIDFTGLGDLVKVEQFFPGSAPKGNSTKLSFHTKDVETKTVRNKAAESFLMPGLDDTSKDTGLGEMTGLGEFDAQSQSFTLANIETEYKNDYLVRATLKKEHDTKSSQKNSIKNLKKIKKLSIDTIDIIERKTNGSILKLSKDNLNKKDKVLELIEDIDHPIVDDEKLFDDDQVAELGTLINNIYEWEALNQTFKGNPLYKHLQTFTVEVGSGESKKALGELPLTAKGKAANLEKHLDNYIETNAFSATASGSGAKVGTKSIKTHVVWNKANYLSGTKMVADPLGPDHPLGSDPDDSFASQATKDMELIANPTGKREIQYIRGHLLNEQLGGPGDDVRNLAPITQNANSSHKNHVETEVKRLVNVEHKWIWYEVEVLFGDMSVDKTVVDADANIKNAVIRNGTKYPQFFICRWGLLDFQPTSTDPNKTRRTSDKKETKLEFGDPWKIRADKKEDIAEPEFVDDDDFVDDALVTEIDLTENIVLTTDKEVKNAILGAALYSAQLGKLKAELNAAKASVEEQEVLTKMYKKYFISITNWLNHLNTDSKDAVVASTPTAAGSSAGAATATIPKDVEQLKSLIAENKEVMSDAYIAAIDYGQIKKARETRTKLKDTALTRLKNALTAILDKDSEYTKSIYKDKIKDKLDNLLQQLLSFRIGEVIVEQVLDETMRKQIYQNRVRGGQSIRHTGKRERLSETVATNVKKKKLSNTDRDILSSYKFYDYEDLQFLLRTQQKQINSSNPQAKRQAYNVITILLDLKDASLDESDDFNEISQTTQTLFTTESGLYDTMLSLTTNARAELETDDVNMDR